MQIVWQRANKLEFNYKLIFKECFMLMICIQVTNAMKDDIAPVIYKIYKEMEPVWAEMFMVGSGQKSETNKTEIKHMRRHKRLMLLVDWKLTGKTWNGYTDWTNTGSFLMDCWMSPQQRLMTSPFHWHQPLVPRCPTGGHELNPCTCLPGHPPALLCRCTTGATTLCSEMLTPSLTLKPTQQDVRNLSWDQEDQVHLTRSSTQEKPAEEGTP